jgi:hypothetical protein
LYGHTVTRLHGHCCSNACICVHGHSVYSLCFRFEPLFLLLASFSASTSSLMCPFNVDLNVTDFTPPEEVAVVFSSACAARSRALFSLRSVLHRLCAVCCALRLSVLLLLCIYWCFCVCCADCLSSADLRACLLASVLLSADCCLLCMLSSRCFCSLFSLLCFFCVYLLSSLLFSLLRFSFCARASSASSSLCAAPDCAALSASVPSLLALLCSALLLLSSPPAVNSALLFACCFLGSASSLSHRSLWCSAMLRLFRSCTLLLFCCACFLVLYVRFSALYLVLLLCFCCRLWLSSALCARLAFSGRALCSLCF